MSKLVQSFLIILLFHLGFSVGAWAQQPTANFTSSPSSGCVPLTVSFTNTSTNATSYLWNFGNNTTSTLPGTVGTTYTTPGTYTVTLTAYNGNQQNVKTGTIVVSDTSSITFTASPTSGCPPLNVNFTASSSSGPAITNYLWSYGNGASGNGATPSYSFPGTQSYYTVSLQATNSAGCISFKQIPNYIHVYNKPQGNFSMTPPSLCSVPGSVSFANTSTGVGPFTANWNFGNSNTGSGNNVSQTYNNSGTYLVSMIVTDNNGCKDTFSKPLFAFNLTTDFTAPATACEGSSVSFTSSISPAPDSVRWLFGSTGTSTGTNTSFFFPAAGTFAVKMIVYKSGCVDTTTKSITIYPKPAGSISHTPQFPCPAPTTIQFNASVANGSSYTWDFGDNSNSSQQNPSHTYSIQPNPLDYYLATCTVTSPNGCTRTFIDTVRIKDIIISTYITPTEGCAPLLCNFSANVTYNQPVVSYKWHFGDGDSSSSQTTTHTYTAVGSYTASLTVVTANGCTKTVSQTISVGIKPTANFTYSPGVTCVKQGVTFTNTSINSTSWHWFFGDGDESFNQNPTHPYQVPGTYTVTLIANNNGCKDTIVKYNIITVNYPLSLPGIQYDCGNALKVNFSNNSLNFNSCLWLFGDGTQSTAYAPSHIYPNLGTYTGKLITFNTTTGCSDTATFLVSLYTLNANFIADDTLVCKGDSVTFTEFITGGPYSNLRWIVNGQLLPLYNNNILVRGKRFDTAGIYTIKMVYKNPNDCYDTVTKTNYITVSWPNTGFRAIPEMGCAPQLVTFYDTSHPVPANSVVSRLWDFGNMSYVSMPNTTTATYTYTAAGNYYTQLITTTYAGCTDTVTKLNYIKIHKPVANFSANVTEGCINAPVTFTSNSSVQGPVTYLWSFGDGTYSTSPTPSKIFPALGTYTIKLVITDDFGCKDSITKPNYITIHDKPTAAFTPSDTFSICSPQFISFANNSTGASSYIWDFGNGTGSIIQSPTAVLNGGKHAIRLIAINNFGCKDTSIQGVRILGYDGALIYNPLKGCAPLPVHFQALEYKVNDFVYDFGDGVTYQTSDTFANHTYTQAGAYLPKVTMSDGPGCKSTSKGLDTIKVDGVFAGFTFTPYPACDKGTITFQDTSKGAYSTIVSRLWIFHDNTTSTSVNPTKTYMAPGTYPIIMIHTTSTGCIDTLYTSVTFHPYPTIDAGPDTTICLTDSATLHPTGGVSYTWTPVTTLSCANCANPKAFPTVQTTYIVTGTDIHGCSNKDSVTINIKTHTTGSFGAGGEICKGDTLQLESSGGHFYTWIPPAGLSDAHISNPTASPDTTTNYIVIVQEGRCIPDTGYINVTVRPLPQVKASDDQTVIAGTVVHISATGNAIVKYEWSPAETLDCASCNETDARPKTSTKYKIQAFTEYGCTDSDFVTIRLICMASQLFIPNTFTPNNNGVNDVFMPRGRGIRVIHYFRIYDRWGKLIFERKELQPNDAGNGWDGTVGGREVPPDTYVYTMEGECDTGEPFTWKGDISLIR